MMIEQPAIHLPPRYINCPVDIVYDGELSAGALRTYLRILGLHWDAKRPPRLNRGQWLRLTGASKTTLRRHLQELASSGWLLSSTDGEGVLSFEFPQKARQDQPKRSRIDPLAVNLNSLGDSINLERVKGLTADPKRRQGVKRAQRDPLLDHPAVMTYREIMHLTPNHVQRTVLASTVSDLGLWREVLEHWAGHGWRPTNITNMLDSYRKGGRAACSLCRERPAEKATEQDQPPPETLRLMIEAARRNQEGSA